MAQPHLRDLQDLLVATVPTPSGGAPITCEHFFSGAAAYVGGHIFASLTPAGLALKLPEVARGELRELGGSPLRYFPGGPVKKDYSVLPGDLADDTSALRPWIARSIAFAQVGTKVPR